ncbi:hypothetical protein ZTR_01012 [Talaromyces verruculosus]|nr:hypothetical protein ZTR_01012 [Talaromyces verruculosus]
MVAQTLKYTTKLANQRVLILGGTSGIGFCVAEAALEHGAHVVISGSNATKLNKAIEKLRTEYPELTATQTVAGYICDLSKPAELEINLQHLLDEATEGGQFKLNHIAFTAGDALQLPSLEELNVDAVQRAGLVRFVAPSILAKLLPKYMDRIPENSFTLTGGSNAHKPAPGWAVMAGYGAAVEGLARGLAVDLKPLRVNVVSPGAVHTEIFSGIANDDLQTLLKRFREDTTTGTVGKAEDLAESYIYVMKDRFITGANVESNGGRLLV